jgi:hypothetical protein
MSPHVRLFRAGVPAGSAQRLSPVAAVHSRLLPLLMMNLAAVAASFSIEN